ncbi:MAG: glycosyltransferase family 4 protein [Chloroflexi bacterium]|nr:glycosyltransferase family 4 protein [Chloroflexota bacterium]
MLIGIDASRAAVEHPTGTERYSREIVRALVAAAPDERFTLYFNRPPASGALPHGENVRWRVIPSPRLWTVGRLSLEMTARPPDVLFVPAHSLPPIVRRASVTTIHDLGYLYFPDEHPPLVRWLRHQSNRTSARRATRTIAISEATRADLIRHYAIPPRRIAVVHHGVGPAFHPIRDPATLARVRARYSLDEPYVLFVGTLQPRKNLERLLRAFDRVARDTHGVTLALAGGAGWLPERIERALDRMTARNRVRRLGYVEDADLPALLSSALALALPSLYEGFGMPALEAMACGTAVLASSTSSLPEVVADAGVLVDPLDQDAIAEALSRLVHDANLRAELGRRGVARATAFTWDRTARETLAVLRAAGRSGGG